MGLQIIVEAQEEGLQMQRNHAIGKLVVLLSKVEVEDAKHTVDHHVDQLAIATAAVGTQLLVHGMLHIQTGSTQNVGAVADDIGFKVIVHHFPFYHITRKEDEHITAPQFPYIEIDAHTGRSCL